MSGLDPARLAEIVQRIPRYSTEVGQVLYRIHRVNKNAVHFSRNTSGRFDPPLGRGTEFGTCYLGVQRLTAYVEVFGRTNPISESMIAERSLTEVAISRPLLVADLTDRTLLGDLGAIPEVSVGPDYGDSGRLAAELVNNFFDGIRYYARHDPGFRLISMALFSSAGSALSTDRSGPIPDDLIIEAEREFGLLVLPAVSLD